MRRVWVGGSLVGITAIISAWVAIGVGGNNYPKPTLIEYPNVENTGVPSGATLTPITGDLQVTEDNTVIDSKNVDGCIIVSGSGVHITRSSTHCVFIEFGSRAANLENPPLVMEDSLIDCGNTDENSLGTSKPRTGINYRNYHVFRTEVTGCENGFDVESNAIIQDNYVHDLWTSNDPDGPHTDGIQSPGGDNLLIQHNTIRAEREGCHSPQGNDGSCNGTSAINIANSASLPSSDNTLIENNWISGGTFTMYCPVNPSKNFRIANNKFSRSYGPLGGQYGPQADCHGEIWFGNVWAETKQPLLAP